MKMFVSWAMTSNKGNRELIDAFDAGLSKQMPESLRKLYDEFLAGHASPEQKLFAALDKKHGPIKT
jgi:hypothetical protein